jgi:hypothetical protein
MACPQAAPTVGLAGDERGREAEERAERMQASEGVAIPLVGHGIPGSGTSGRVTITENLLRLALVRHAEAQHRQADGRSVHDAARPQVGMPQAEQERLRASTLSAMAA